MENDPERPPQLTGAAAAIFEAMSQISEAAHGVRWMQGTEYGVWMLLTEPRVRWGRVRADDADVAPALVTIEALARQAQVWVTWVPCGGPPMEMSLDNWRVRYASAVPALRRSLA